MNTRVTPTLARGLTGRMLKSAKSSQVRRLQAMLAEGTKGRSRAGSRQRQYLKMMDRLYDEQILFKTESMDGKHTVTQHVWWEQVEGHEALTILVSQSSIKHWRKSDDLPLSRVLVLVWTHAIERMFERLNTVEISEVNDEIRGLAVQFACMVNAGFMPADMDGLYVPTPHGAGITAYEQGEVVTCRTWLSDTSMARAVRARWDQERLKASLEDGAVMPSPWYTYETE